MDKSNTTIYLEQNGTLVVISGITMGLFEMLGNLGIKSVPNKRCIVMTTTNTAYVPSGSYTVSYSSSSTTVTLTDSLLPKEACKLEKSRSREDRQHWRSYNKKHSMNTGRRY